MEHKNRYEYFYEILKNTYSGPDSDELISLLKSYYTVEWFEKNDYEFSMSHSSLFAQPPLSIVQNCIYRNAEILRRFFDDMKLVHSRIGLSEERLKRLTNPALAFQTYFELKISTLLSIAGFKVVCDFPTARNKDVEARIEKDEFSCLVECKVLILSDKSVEFYKWKSIYMGYLTQQHIERKASVCGEVEYYSHFGEETWREIIGCTMKAIETGDTYTFETSDVKLTVCPMPTQKYPTLRTTEVFPETKRIKSTLDKAQAKLKNAGSAVLFCCVPREAGQSSAVEEIKKLLKNKKYKQISQAILVDPLYTFETEFTRFNELVNPNSKEQFLFWDKEQLKFEIRQSGQV